MDPEIIEIKRYRNSVFKEQNSLVHSRPDQGAAGPGAQLGRGALFCIQLNPAITDLKGPTISIHYRRISIIAIIRNDKKILSGD